MFHSQTCNLVLILGFRLKLTSYVVSLVFITCTSNTENIKGKYVRVRWEDSSKLSSEKCGFRMWLWIQLVQDRIKVWTF